MIMKILQLIGAMALAAAVAGCAAPPVSQYYTLLPGAGRTDRVAPVHKARYAISVQPVQLPEQVDRPQIVISSQDSAQVVPLNNSLWVSPLSDEIRHALADDLSQQLGVLDIPVRGAPESLPLWKIYLTVQRFESVYNQHVVLDATWRLTPVNQPGKTVKICRAEVQVAVQPGIPALIAGHQQALHELAAVIAAQLSGRAPSTSEPGVSSKGCV
jgi:uncharacterized lipoprotein YmbA